MLYNHQNVGRKILLRGIVILFYIFSRRSISNLLYLINETVYVKFIVEDKYIIIV